MPVTKRWILWLHLINFISPQNVTINTFSLFLSSGSAGCCCHGGTRDAAQGEERWGRAPDRMDGDRNSWRLELRKGRYGRGTEGACRGGQRLNCMQSQLACWLGLKSLKSLCFVLISVKLGVYFRVGLLWRFNNQIFAKYWKNVRGVVVLCHCFLISLAM